LIHEATGDRECGVHLTERDLMTNDFDNDNDIDYSDNEIEDNDDKIKDSDDESQDEDATRRLGTAYVKKKHGGMIDHETGTANPLDADVLPEQESEEDEIEVRRGKKAEDDEEHESKLLRAVAVATAKQQFKEKLKAAQAKFGKLPNPPKKASNDNFRPVVSWPLVDQLTRRAFEPDAERRTKNIVLARYLRELIDTAEADPLGSSVYLPGKSAPGDHDMQRTESGKVFFEHGQTLDRRKVTYDEKNGEADAERYSGSPRTARKSLPVGNSGFNLPFPVRKRAAREELDAIIADVGPALWPYLLMAISYNATMTDIGLALGFKRYQAPREGTAIIRSALTAAMESLDRLNGIKDDAPRPTPLPVKSRGHFLNQSRNHVRAA
jgi:hypothetical protein